MTNPDVLVQIRAAANDQSPVTDCSHLIVFAAWDNYTEDRIDEVTQLNIDARGEIPLIHQYYGNLKANYVPRPGGSELQPMPRAKPILRSVLD